MKPLVNYCRWKGAKLRLQGRDETAVWGELVFDSENGVHETQEFHFNLRTSELSVREGEEELLIVLDEMGIPLKSS